ncbi:hypothetical protein BKA70DRAFT_1242223 [Coprinopsis sp. MPI-PUGE-AT-0042]|nr:hypothetical protein BKA70DRAFT_1242223 [Coprinopsis sp. MPI-PUGE-AT-0042]
MARNKNNAPPTRRSAQLGANTDNHSTPEGPSVPPPPPPPPPPQDLDHQPAAEKPQPAAGIDLSSSSAPKGRKGKKAPARKNLSKAKKTKELTPLASGQDAPILDHNVAGINGNSVASVVAILWIASCTASSCRRDGTSSPPPALGRRIEPVQPAQPSSKPMPIFFGSVPAHPLPASHGSVGERLLRLRSLMAQTNVALAQPLGDQVPQRLDQQDVFLAPTSSTAPEEANSRPLTSFSLPTVSPSTPFDTERHHAKRLKTIHTAQFNSPLKHSTTRTIEPTTSELDHNAPSLALTLLPKQFNPLFPSPDVSKSPGLAEDTNSAAQEPLVTPSRAGSPPPCPTPPTNSLLPYRKALPHELPSPTSKVFLMVGRTHPKYPDYAFNSRVIGQVFPRPADYIPTGFERYTTFWTQGMGSPLLIPPTHTTSGVVTGHLPHVERDWRDVHQFLARCRARNNTAGPGYLPPSSPPDGSDSSLIESSDSGSDFEDTQLALRERGKPTSLSPSSSETDMGEVAPPVPSKRTHSGRSKGQESLPLRQDVVKAKEGKGKSKAQPSFPRLNVLCRDERDALNEIVADLSHLSSLTNLDTFQMLSVVGMYHPSSAQLPEEPVELTHDERTSIFDLEARLSAFAAGLNIEWYQVLEMVDITYPSQRTIPPVATLTHVSQAYHPNRSNVSLSQLAPLNPQPSSHQQKKRRRQRQRSKSPYCSSSGSDNEAEHQPPAPLQHPTAPQGAQQLSRRQKKRRRQQASMSSQCASPGRNELEPQPCPSTHHSNPPQPTTASPADQVTIDDVVGKVVELAQTFSIHPFELLRWGGVSDPDPTNDEDRPPRPTRFGNPYTIFAQYRSITHPRTDGMTIGQWQQETAADYKEQYGHLKKDQLERESQNWVKAVLDHDRRTGDSHAVSRYSNSDPVKSFKKAITDVKNLARRIVRYGKDIHIAAAVYSSDSVAQQASTVVASDSCIPGYIEINKLDLRGELDRLVTFSRASSMGFLGSSRLEEPWVFGASSESGGVSNSTRANTSMQPGEPQRKIGGHIRLDSPSQASDKAMQPDSQATRQVSPPSPHADISDAVSDDPQTHLDAFAAGLSITFPSGAGEKKKFLRKFFRVVWNNMWATVLGRDAGKAFNQLLDNCLRTRHRLRGWDSTVTPSPGDPGFDPNRLAVEFLSRFYKSFRSGKRSIWLEEWTAETEEKIISRSDREYERIPVVIDSNEKVLRRVQHCPTFLRNQVKSEVTVAIDNLTQKAPVIDRARAQVNARKLVDSFTNAASCQSQSDPLADIRSLLTSIAKPENAGLPSNQPQPSSTLASANRPVDNVAEDDHFSEPYRPETQCNERLNQASQHRLTRQQPRQHSRHRHTSRYHRHGSNSRRDRNPSLNPSRRSDRSPRVRSHRRSRSRSQSRNRGTRRLQLFQRHGHTRARSQSASNSSADGRLHSPSPRARDYGERSLRNVDSYNHRRKQCESAIVVEEEAQGVLVLDLALCTLNQRLRGWAHRNLLLADSC